MYIGHIESTSYPDIFDCVCVRQFLFSARDLVNACPPSNVEQASKASNQKSQLTNGKAVLLTRDRVEPIRRQYSA